MDGRIKNKLVKFRFDLYCACKNKLFLAFFLSIFQNLLFYIDAEQQQKFSKSQIPKCQWNTNFVPNFLYWIHTLFVGAANEEEKLGISVGIKFPIEKWRFGILKLVFPLHNSDADD